MPKIILESKLTVYIPTERWEQIEPLLPPEYSMGLILGKWKGQTEGAIQIVRYASWEDNLLLRAVLIYALLEAGEEAVLSELDGEACLHTPGFMEDL